VSSANNLPSGVDDVDDVDNDDDNNDDVDDVDNDDDNNDDQEAASPTPGMSPPTHQVL
jgi:hypothetical protein